MPRKTAESPSRSTSRPPPRDRAAPLLRKLKKMYPEARCALEHQDAFELLIATILSAQCTDERVNQVTPGLFRRYPTPAALSRARQEDVEKIIHSTGFYRNKARSLIEASRAIVENHGGRVPDEMDALLELRGVARKTANVVLGNAYGKNEGVVVDTHVQRLSRRMGLTRQNTPEKIEKDLIRLFPQRDWALLSHLLIWHGRKVCNARKPACETCGLKDLCPRLGVKT